mgnify:CR=1 FL=1|jgi:hypothetical protein
MRIPSPRRPEQQAETGQDETEASRRFRISTPYALEALRRKADPQRTTRPSPSNSRCPTRLAHSATLIDSGTLPDRALAS